MKIGIIAAMGKNRSIGFKGELPWLKPIPADWENLEKATSGASMIMGRKSYQDKNRISSNKRNIVISRNPNLKLEPGFTKASSLNEALKILSDEEIVWILGGQKLFEEAIDMADIMVLTYVDKNFEGDRFFPDFDENKFKITKELSFEKGEKSPYNLKIVTYEREK